MRYRGTATIYGADGTVKHNTTALAAIVESLENEQTANIEELKDGQNRLVGFAISDDRETVDLTLVPASTTSVANALAALAFPALPLLIKLSDFALDALNGDYIYMGGCRRSFTARGKAAVRIRIFKPTESGGKTVAELLTEKT